MDLIWPTPRPPQKSFQDDTIPETIWTSEGWLDEETFEWRFQGALQAFKDTVFGPGYDAELAEAKERAGQKAASKTAAKRKVRATGP